MTLRPSVSPSLRRISRRTMLRGAGVAMALPALDAMMPVFGRAARAAAKEAAVPRRMVCICTPLGLHTPNLFPEQAGAGYASTPYLDVLQDVRADFTVISGLQHPGVDWGHDSIASFLTAVPHPERRAGFRNRISLDQFAAEHIGGLTRFPSLALSHEGSSLSWTRSGAMVPAQGSPAKLFARMFLDGRPDEVEAQVRRLRDGQSLLDAVGEQAREMQGAVGARDREKLDEYFTSVRELERGLAVSEQWSKKPKPQVDAKQPQDVTSSSDLVGKTRLNFEIIHLAFQTDSTRIATVMLGGTSTVPTIPGVTMAHHDLSHHGRDPEKLRQLKIVEMSTMQELHDLVVRLKGTREQGRTLLDRTAVFLGSNLGSGSGHSCKNLPVIVAGGGFKHGQHLAFQPQSAPPLCNLYVSMLERLGIEADQFGSSSGTLTGL
jgi:hypothetical protein